MAAYNANDLIELIEKAVDKAGVEFGFSGFCALEKEIGLPEGWLTNLYNDSIIAQKQGKSVFKNYSLVTAIVNYAD